MQQVHRQPSIARALGLDPAFGPAPDLPRLEPGTRLEIVKLDPAGAQIVTYPGVVLPNPDQPDWVVTEARWINRTVDLDGLVFHTGDRLVESFSAVQPYNCFAVHDPETDALRGWYANITYPVRVDLTTDPVRLIWHDLYLDVIGNPDGVMSLRDEDELDESGLAASDPALHRAIVEAAAYVMTHMRQRGFPFGPTVG